MRAAEADALVGLDERALDQDRVLDHGIEDLIVGDVRTGQSQFLGQGLLGTKALARAYAGAVLEALQFIAARRRLQIFMDEDVETVVAQELERLAGRSAHRVVINFCFHRRGPSHKGFNKLNKDLTPQTSFSRRPSSRLRNDAT